MPYHDSAQQGYWSYIDELGKIKQTFWLPLVSSQGPRPSTFFRPRFISVIPYKYTSKDTSSGHVYIWKGIVLGTRNSTNLTLECIFLVFWVGDVEAVTISLGCS